MFEEKLYFVFEHESIFPFGSKPSIILDILSRRILLKINNPAYRHYNKITFQNLSYLMTQLAWGVFYTNLAHDDETINNKEKLRKSYHKFLDDLSVYFSPEHQELDDAMKYFGFVLKEESEKTSIVSHSIMISDDYIIAQFDMFNKYDKLIASNVIDALRQKKDEDGQNFFGIIWNAIFKYSGHFIFNKDPIDYYAKKDEYKFQTSKWFYRQIMNMNHDITIDLFQKVILGIINQYEGRPIGPGKVVYYNPDPQLFKPSITCLEEDKNTLYVYLRGSYEPQDWISDFYCNEVGEVIQDVSIIFHYGFLTAANNIIKLIGSILKKYNTIYLIGHSYGGAIA